MPSSDPELAERHKLRRRFWRRFLVGLAVGTAVSTAPMLMDMRLGVAPGANLFFVLSMVKFVLAIVLLFNKEWRGFGGGLLMAIPLGFLIFFMTCLLMFRWS